MGTLLYQNGGLGFFDKKVAYAVGDLSVVWESDPLFNYSNIAPGFEITKTVGVTNSAPSTRSVAIKGIETTDTGNMSNVMHIEIKEGASVIYYDSLTNFFASSASPFGIFLSDLANGANTEYTVRVIFDESAGNEFQNKNIVFDLQIGITVGLPTACTQISFPNNPIIGTAGNDKINGTSKNDLIITYEGDDRVSASGGDDCIITGEGKDRVDGGTGLDVIDLGDGDDKNTASNNNDIVFGGNGNDDIDSGSGNDKVYGGSGNDKLVGGSDNDEVFGEEGNDELEGGSGNDNLLGGVDVDKAKGGSGTDACDAENETTCEL